MSRSGYTDCSGAELAMWRGAVQSAIRGARGQTLLRDMLSALDALPVKRLIRNALVTPDGECCALGSVALARNLDVSEVEPTERDEVAMAFNIAPAMAAEIAYVNDDSEPRWVFEADADPIGPGKWVKAPEETPEQRWVRVRAWVAEQIKGHAGSGSPGPVMETGATLAEQDKA